MAKKIKSIMIDLILLLILIFILITIYNFYKKYNYRDFVKAETTIGISQFSRDSNIKYTKENSYKIESPKYNDAVFYKEVEVEPYTAYRVTCVLKTENVEAENSNTECGAQICILDSTESSRSIVGTQDWQKVEFMFNSKNRTTVKIGFRLGSNYDNAKGTAWFSDFKLEKGDNLIEKEDNDWNMAFFIFKNTDVVDESKDIDVQLTMDEFDLKNTKNNIERFKNSCESLSNGKIKITYDLYEIDEPISSVSYSEEYGYYVNTTDVKEFIEAHIQKEEYDYICTLVRLGDANKGIEIPTHDWIGLRRNDFL